MDGGQALASVNGKLSAVNSLFQFLGLTDCRVKAVKIQCRAFRDTSRDMTKDEYHRLLKATLSVCGIFSDKQFKSLLAEAFLDKIVRSAFCS